MKIKHIKESTFTEVEHDYPDFQYELATKIHEAFGEKRVPIMANDDGEKLHVLVIDPSVNNMDSDTGLAKYRVTIEQLKPYRTGTDMEIIINAQKVRTDKKYLTCQDIVDYAFGEGKFRAEQATMIDYVNDVFGVKGSLSGEQKVYVAPNLVISVSMSTPVWPKR